MADMGEVFPKFYAGAIIWNPDTRKILLQKRDRGAPLNPNMWSLFGGSGEDGEEPSMALVRELREELSVTIDPLSAKRLWDYPNPEFQKQRIIFLVTLRLRKEEMRLSEGEDMEWVSLEDALELPLSPRTRQDLVRFLDEYRSAL